MSTKLNSVLSLTPYIITTHQNNAQSNCNAPVLYLTDIKWNLSHVAANPDRIVVDYAIPSQK
jgi:hypothetical protein